MNMAQSRLSIEKLKESKCIDVIRLSTHFNEKKNSNVDDKFLDKVYKIYVESQLFKLATEKQKYEQFEITLHPLLKLYMII